MFFTKTNNRMAVFADLYGHTLGYMFADESGNYKQAEKPLSFNGRLDDDFFARLKETLAAIKRENNFTKTVPVNLILPDRFFFFDIVKIPVTKKQRPEAALEISLKNLYFNRSELSINRSIAAQNKQNISYAIVGIRREILASFHAAFSAVGFSVKNITHASGALASCLSQNNPKAKGASYLTLKIKENAAFYSFVAKGRTVGTFALPFGYSVLYDDHTEAENMLFDHTDSELLVLNAIERAKQKNLTVLRDLSEEDAEEDSEEEEGERESMAVKRPKYLAKKTPKKLPKFMQRPEPESAEGYIFENFRYFLKQTLELIENNALLTAAGMPETVYMHIPERFAFLFGMINAEEEENGIRFSPLSVQVQHTDVTDRAELYGGLVLDRFNKNNNF